MSREGLSKLLKGKIIKICRRHTPREVLIEFVCGTRLYVDAQGALEVSITDGSLGGDKDNERA